LLSSKLPTDPFEVDADIPAEAYRAQSEPVSVRQIEAQRLDGAGREFRLAMGTVFETQLMRVSAKVSRENRAEGPASNDEIKTSFVKAEPIGSLKLVG
jgi:hypothetical protein